MRKRLTRKSWTRSLLMVAGVLLLSGLIGCGGAAPVAPAGIGIKPIIPAEPRLPTFSEQFNRTAPVADLEKLGNYVEEVHGVYRILSGQLKER